MKWAVGILTWNQPEICNRNLELLRENLSGADDVFVLDNGSDIPFESPRWCRAVRNEVNLGNGGGITSIAREALRTNAEALLIVEEDIHLIRPLDLRAVDPLFDIPDVGVVCLIERPREPSRGFWTYALKGEAAEISVRQASSIFHPYAHGEYQVVHLMLSHPGLACTRLVAERFLCNGTPEAVTGRAYLESGMLTASTVPGHFRVSRSIREGRNSPGWRQ